MQTLIYEVPDSNKQLYIMRGLPGSGKSTLARSLSDIIFSTDDFFMKDGVYVFDFKKIGVAHKWNQERCEKALDKGKNPVVVDNTNTKSSELKPYVQAGIKNQYNITICEPDAPHSWDVDVLVQRNQHGATEEIIRKMLARYEKDLTLEKILG